MAIDLLDYSCPIRLTYTEYNLFCLGISVLPCVGYPKKSDYVRKKHVYEVEVFYLIHSNTR